MPRGEEPLPRFLGDHPHGADWSADPLPGDQDIEDVPHAQLDGDARLGTTSAYAALDARARDLVARLERAIGDRFVVKYRPWAVLPDE